MKPCAYRSPYNEQYAACSNTKDLVHNGIVPLAICEVCPYAAEKDITGLGDLIARGLDAIGITKQRVQTVASAVGISDCGCGNRQQKLNELFPFTTPAQPGPELLQFIWPYWQGGAQGDELRWSMRSVQKYYAGQASFLLIGDRPDWYTGPYLPQARVHKHTPNRGFRDMLAKVRTMAHHEATASRFVWMMDDIYFIKPFDLEALQVPRADHWHPSSGNGWQRRKHNTMRVLTGRGYSTYDYATHLPHVVEKDKLSKLFTDFELDQNTLLWEVLYGNVHRHNPQPSRPFLLRTWKHHTVDEYARLTQRSVVLNNTDSAWCSGLRQYLMSLLPEPCSIESSDAPKILPTQHNSRSKRIVKRRPLHTQRAYIEKHAIEPQQ